MNKQITEDYCSFEVAKLLKEKGFDIPVRFEHHCVYNLDQKPQFHRLPHNFNGNEYSGLTSQWYSAPTHQMAFKWLREVHNIHISINVGCDVDNKNYVFYTPTIVKLNNKSVEYIDPFCEDEDEFDSNEEAVEAALKYSLENLI